jgi:transposase-like protein
MNWTVYKKGKDGYAWKCQSATCSNFKKTTSIRHLSFFSNSNLQLQKWIHALYLWCIEEQACKASQQLNLSPTTVVQIYKKIRSICKKYFKGNPIRFGGTGITCQIDESCFSHKPKHHRGRANPRPLWVFGIVDTSTSPSIGFMKIVDNRAETALLPIIKEIVRPGTRIYSDQWAAYRNLNMHGYIHQTVNHSLHFVNPISGVHTQNIESYWNKHKSRIKAMRGMLRSSLDDYLMEFMWRERFEDSGLYNICAHISTQYPV